MTREEVIRLAKKAGLDTNDFGCAVMLPPHEKLARFAELVAAPLQAKIDDLMLEFCPEEMTQEQVDNWMKHQVKSPFDIAVEKQEAAFDAAIRARGDSK